MSDERETPSDAEAAAAASKCTAGSDRRRQSQMFAAEVGSTTYLETLMHILKGNVGSGVFAMGDAVKNGGLLLAPALTLLMGLVCVHSQHILLSCSQQLKERLGNTVNPDFAETVEMCIAGGPPALRAYAKRMKCVVNVFLCITQMGFCCIYFVFISSTMKQICDAHGWPLAIHAHMAAILVPILLPSLITNLKVLAICSAVANVCMSSGIGMVFYYAMQDMPPMASRPWVGEPQHLPLFFGTAIFAFEGIALVLPLKNSMRRTQQFDRRLGVLNVGMAVVTVVFTAFGFVGYLKWGDETAGSLTLNLPEDDVLAVVVKLTVSLGMALTFPLQFFVPVQIMLPAVQERFEAHKRPVLVEMALRTGLVVLIFLIAELVPKLSLFISLIGAFCSSALALAFPPLIQIIYEGTAKRWLLAKNCLILAVALLGFATGTYESLSRLVQELFGGGDGDPSQP